MNRVTIVVEGGVVQNVISDEPMEYALIDYDTEGMDEEPTFIHGDESYAYIADPEVNKKANDYIFHEIVTQAREREGE